jgi:UDP:flavonoid glycosyltransferase YjiC (YdhE family)
MKILIASTGLPGHLNPLLTIARILRRHDHEVLVLTSPELKVAVLATGVPFRPEIPESKTYFVHALELPGRESLSQGMEAMAFDLEQHSAPNLFAQAVSLEMALEDFPADLILTDSSYFGTLPLLMGPRRERPAIAHVGISVLNLGSGKNLPKRPGMSDEDFEAERLRRRRVLLQPAQWAVDRALIEVDCDTLPCPVLESMATLPDLYLQLGIESFEYPERIPFPSQVRYIGRLPLPGGEAALPAWWHEVDRKKRLVLVTQGALANRDFRQLVGPALQGLAEEEDLIVLVTTGGRPVDSIPVEIPANARVAPFLSFGQLMPHIDLLITNGGYGTVNMALAHGVPIVAAGLMEDKEEVSAHVAWAGVGIDLRTGQPDPEVLRRAVREVLDTPSYRKRAQEMALEFASHDTEEELLYLLERCVRRENGLVSDKEEETSSELAMA